MYDSKEVGKCILHMDIMWTPSKMYKFEGVGTPTHSIISQK